MHLISSWLWEPITGGQIEWGSCIVCEPQDCSIAVESPVRKLILTGSVWITDWIKRGSVGYRLPGEHTPEHERWINIELLLLKQWVLRSGLQRSLNIDAGMFYWSLCANTQHLDRRDEISMYNGLCFLGRQWIELKVQMCLLVCRKKFSYTSYAHTASLALVGTYFCTVCFVYFIAIHTLLTVIPFDKKQNKTIGLVLRNLLRATCTMVY